MRNTTSATALACWLLSMPLPAAQAAEAPSYSRQPFAGNGSQTEDALLGNYKYQKPLWNSHDLLNLPQWLSFTVDQRTRFETLDGRINANAKGGDQQIPLQTTAWLEAKINRFRLGTEFMDARAIGADSGSGINTSQANTADFTQAYLAWSDQNLGYSGIGIEAIAGRQTLNFGSRRLVSRSAMANTVSSFTGGRLRVLRYNNWQLNGFVTLPVLRLPGVTTALLNDTHQWDEEDDHTVFSGGFLELFDVIWGINAESYLYHLDEGDSPINATRNRRYFTPGMRFYSKPTKGMLDFSIEAIGQLGHVRATTAASDKRDIDHAAWSHHVDVGYTIDMPWTPRFAVQYDYASGNGPDKTLDQRFDPLYGDRRFEFGPTGIYGAFSRSNINAPSYRVTATPQPDITLMFDHRFVWLASAVDCWGGATCTGNSLVLQPKANGASGDFVGQQIEITARWDVNSSLNLETGWTHLFKEQFAQQATAAPNGNRVDYVYIQSQLRF